MIRRPGRLAAVLAGAVALALTLAACGGEGGSGEAKVGKDGKVTVKVGYLHTIAVDGTMWLGMEKGYYEKYGITLEPVKFDTGIAESQALAGGSIDLAIMGGVTSNFPARGQGRIVIANDVEYDTAQLWVQGDSGIDSVQDLAGKKVATTQGTTAHIYLHNALKKAGVDPKSVQIVNSSMSNAVQAFASGAVPAIALWVPFDLQVKKARPEAKMIDSAKNYYPDAAIVDGWVANNQFYKKNRDVLVKVAKGWLDANADLTSNPDEALRIVHQRAYADDATLDDLKHQFGFQKNFTNEEWVKNLQDGSLLEWVGRAEQVFVDIGGLPKYTEPEEFVDTSIVLDAVEKK